MTTRQFCLYSFIFIGFIFSNACVSVSLQKSEAVPAKDVKYDLPSIPFEEMSLKTADKTWISKSSGNTISYISDCQKDADPTLDQMQNESLAALENLKVLDSETISFNSRNALTSTVEGLVDGVPIKMKVLVFKKNACNYTLTYAGVKKHFDTELKQFDHFQASFKAP